MLLHPGIVTLVALVLGACATTGRWPPETGSEDAARKITREWIGRTVAVEAREAGRSSIPAEDQAVAENVLVRGEKLHLLQLDRIVLRGETADGVLTLPLESVQSISYRKRLATGVGGGLLGIVLGTVLGQAAARTGTNCTGDIGGTCLVVPIIGAAAGLIIGATVGALVGYEKRLIIDGPRSRSLKE